MNHNRIIPSSKYHLSAVFFIGIVHSIGLIGYPLYCYFYGWPQWQEISAFFFMYFLAILGVNFGYHRGLTHRSFEMSRPLRFLSLFAASSTGENSALCWCSDHRRHHRYEDTERDPYNIKKGFWWAHMGWIFASPPGEDFSNCPDLLKDPIIRHQHKYYALWLIVSAFGLPLAIGFLLGRPMATLLLAGFTRIFLVNQFTYLVNSYAHYFGRQPYDTKITAKDSLVVAVLASGEGWHNFHHRFPFDFRNGHKWYHWDPVKWMISFAHYTGHAWNLKQTPQVEIYRAKLETQQSRLAVKSERMKELEEILHNALLRWRQMSYEWQQLKASLDHDRKEKMKALRVQIREAKREFKTLYEEWQSHYFSQMALSA